MTDATQTSDRLTLDECLGAMRRIGVAPEDYVEGYEAGYLNLPYNFGRGLAYARGRSAGLDAWGRGAHGAEQPTWAPLEILLEDGVA